MSFYVRPKQPSVLMDFDDCRTNNSSFFRGSSLDGGLWKAKTKLFVMQHTYASQYEVRMDNRRTWMHFSKVNVTKGSVFSV